MHETKGIVRIYEHLRITLEFNFFKMALKGNAYTE